MRRRVSRMLVGLVALGAGVGAGAGATTVAGALGSEDPGVACPQTVTDPAVVCVTTTVAPTGTEPPPDPSAPTTTTDPGTPALPGGPTGPVEPQPVEPQPVEPQPVEPQPVDPQPVEPLPVEPPADPDPVEPPPAAPAAAAQTTGAPVAPPEPPAIISPAAAVVTPSQALPPAPEAIVAATTARIVPRAHRRHRAVRRTSARPRPAPARDDVLVRGSEEPGSASGAAYSAGPPIDVAAFGPLRAPAFAPGAATSLPFPTWLLAVYQAAGTRYDVPWPVLASINEIETDYGKNATVSSAGAVGWMQFMPSTWATYGTDGDGDGVADPAHPVDAIFSAARYLKASGAQRDLGRAVFSYNHAGWYVRKVLGRAQQIGSVREDLLASLTRNGVQTGRNLLASRARVDSLDRAMLLDDVALRGLVLEDRRVSIYPCGREDIANGVTDRRVLLVLLALRYAGLDPTVSSLRCGHGLMTASGNVSEHSSGSAVDIAAINGIPIIGHQGQGTVTDKAIRVILGLQGALDPHQIISLMTYAGRSETLALADHADHIHVGFHPLRPLTEDSDNG